jgi:[acyl-carrier-protein] S-malonyltransferase
MTSTTPTRRLVEALVPGATVGDIAGIRDRVNVTTPHGGQTMQWLVEDRDLVPPCQPLVRLHPEGSS